MATHLARALEVPLSYFWAVDDDEAELLLLYHGFGSRMKKQALRSIQELAATK